MRLVATKGLGTRLHHKAIPQRDSIQTYRMATENSKLSSAELERVAPVCQLARAQASIQAKMRPGMWLPGVRNLHMARQIWEIKGTPDECVDKMVAAVDAVPQEELMEVSKVCRLLQELTMIAG